MLPGGPAPVDPATLARTLDRSFRSVLPALAETVARVRERRWLDGYPRPGKGSVGSGELSADALSDISRRAFRHWLCPCLKADHEDAFVWVHNSFYYLEPFFNWSYTFAYAAAALLPEQLRDDVEGAPGRLQALIREAALGEVDAAFLKVFGLDCGSEAFVAPSYRRVDRCPEAFEAALAACAPAGARRRGDVRPTGLPAADLQQAAAASFGKGIMLCRCSPATNICREDDHGRRQPSAKPCRSAQGGPP